MNAKVRATLHALYRYPVKGLSPEALETVALEAGATIPFDRAYAIENGPGKFDPKAPRHVPKINFVMLMRDEKLATLRSTFDDTSKTLTITKDGVEMVRASLETTEGRAAIETFIAAYMGNTLRGKPKVVSAPGHSISDVAAKCLHIVNLASVRALETLVGRPIDPLRFRPNMVIDGLPAYEELAMIGQKFTAGTAAFSIFKRTMRCAATNVDPNTGARDMTLQDVLLANFGHSDFGVYAKVTAAGTASVRDALILDQRLL